jgi:Bacterial antitoxin of type II TA system, VapB
VQKGQPLFQFDRRPYEYKVRQLEADLNAARERVVSYGSKIKRRQAELVAANQDVLMLKEDEQATDAKVQKIKSEVTYAELQHQRYEDLAGQGAGTTDSGWAIWLLRMAWYGTIIRMKKTLHIDEKLLQEARTVSRAATDTETVRMGLEALIRHAAHERLRALRGTEPAARDVPRRREGPARKRRGA